MNGFYNSMCKDIEIKPSVLEEGQVPFPLALRMRDIYILEGEHVLPAMAYTALKIHHTKAIKRCSRPLGQARVSQMHVPAPTAPKAKITIQDTVAVWEQTRGPATRAVMIRPPESFGLRITEREVSWRRRRAGKAAQSPLAWAPLWGPQSPGAASPTESPEYSRWGGLCQCASLPNLSGPEHREDDSSDAGSREGLWMWAPPRASEPPEPGPMQAVPAWGPRLKTSPYWHGSPTHSGDSHGLEPARASPGLGDQARVPSLARGLLTSYSLGHLDDGCLLEERPSPASVLPRLGSSLPCVFTASYALG
ncbi:uncharacterized protein [Oryctolagus cuniculus]